MGAIGGESTARRASAAEPRSTSGYRIAPFRQTTEPDPEDEADMVNPPSTTHKHP